MNEYPTLSFLLDHAQAVALVAAAAPVAGAVLAILAGASALWLFAGIVVGAIGYGLVRSYVELIKLVTDMLMPK
ncbi:MAG TPA: hypothetical protein VL966_07635 [Alphaproteobacteria bacterium]|jgi:carbon starvation protein CstA|nr:hypothetical protein [Alphaproteobacteria bacterium]